MNTKSWSWFTYIWDLYPSFKLKNRLYIKQNHKIWRPNVDIGLKWVERLRKLEVENKGLRTFAMNWLHLAIQSSFLFPNGLTIRPSTFGGPLEKRSKPARGSGLPQPWLSIQLSLKCVVYFKLTWHLGNFMPPIGKPQDFWTFGYQVLLNFSHGVVKDKI